MNEDVKSTSVHIHSRADELIACLEGEIAKRDAWIVELESELVLRREDHYRMDSELAALKAQEPVAWISKDGTYAEASTKSTVYGSHTLPLYAAPVPVENAQVVMPERWNVPRPMWKDARKPYGNPLNHADIEAEEKFNLALDEVARLNAAPVQQVSVQGGCKLVPVNATEAILDVLYSNGMDESDSLLQEIWSAMLAAAPAAPAADAGVTTHD